MIEEMKAIQVDHSLLPQEYQNINVCEIPCYIMTYNREFEKQDTYKDMRGHSKIVFVCSTDDPYLDTFKEECTEEVLVFNKADYCFSDKENGDSYGLEEPYNKCGVFARRFLDDYTRKNGIERFIVVDNDLKINIKMCDKKAVKFEENPSLVDFCIKLYFYLLEKYDFMQYVTATNSGVEMMGKLYDIGFYFCPASVNFHLASRPCKWIARLGDDFVTPLNILKETGRLSLNLPIFIQRQTTVVGGGDMSAVYKKVSEEYKDTPLMKEYTGRANFGVQTVQVVYMERFFPGSTKKGKLLRSALIRKLVEERSKS